MTWGSCTTSTIARRDGGDTDDATAPNCPMADMLVEDVRTQVAKIPGVERVNVALVFDPPWDKDMMSDEAKLELGFM